MSAFQRWSQPVDATLYLEGEMECGLMGHRFHRGFTAAEKTELWDRWKRGESLNAIVPRWQPSSAAQSRYRPHPEELAKQASRRMAATQGLAAILRDAKGRAPPDEVGDLFRASKAGDPVF